MITKALATVTTAVALAMTPAAVPQQQVAVVPAAITITGVDSHDGMIYQDNGVYYWAGTRYGCGFTWMDTSKPWCGFGVWTAPAVTGPWTFVRNLFDPAGSSGTYFSESWQTICRGDGCFNPRMTRRTDGVWVLWFNAPRDQLVHSGNQFWAMGCNGPAGPCGAAAGAPYGSTAKPPLWICNTGGDFSILDDAGTWYLFCGTSTHTISVERLQPWGTTGTGVGAQNLAGLSYVEGAGVFRSGTDYIITFGGNCPYCSATDTSYAVAASPLGPFVTPPGPALRRTISGGSCGGQPRTVVTLNGQAYEQVDHWYDAWNETDAATSLFPLVRTGVLLQPANGLPWTGFAPFDCEVQP
jgi:hypothetical protein